MFAAPLFFKILYVCSTITMFFSRFAIPPPPPPPQCKLLVYQDRRHLFVTSLLSAQGWGEEILSCCVLLELEKCTKTVHTEEIIGAANTAALALFEILTQFLLLSMCFHH
jgi:hypothetical protein